MLTIYHFLIQDLKTKQNNNPNTSENGKRGALQEYILWARVETCMTLGAIFIISLRKVLSNVFLPNNSTSRNLFKEITRDADNHLSECLEMFILALFITVRTENNAND